MFRLIAVLVLLHGFAIQSTPARGPVNVLLSRGRTEPSVAIDSRHPSTMVVGANTDYGRPVGGAYPTAFYTSHDGGRSFVSGTAPLVSPYVTAADTTTVIDKNGTVFYSYLAETDSYCTTGHSGVLLTHSIDHGGSFRPPLVVDTDAADDKPDMAVESVRNRPSHIFLSWTRWHDAGNHVASSDIVYARSGNGGASFGRHLLLYSSHADNMGSVPVVGSHGRVAVFWLTVPDGAESAVQRATIEMRSSSDDGKHFGPAHAVGPAFPRVPLMAAPGSLRNLTMPAVAVGKGSILYAAWPVVSRRLSGGRVTSDIILRRSLDWGKHWSRGYRINDSRLGDRFMPSISVLADGSVGVAFYDRRRGGSQVDLYAARASFARGFHVSPNVRVNRGTSPIADIYYIAPSSTCFIPGRFFGDYIGTAAVPDGTWCVAWTDTQLQTPSQTDVWMSRFTLPAVAVTPPTAHAYRRAYRSG